MELTGKAKEDFEKWYNNNYPTRHSKIKMNYKVWVGESWDVPSTFWWLPYSMRWGVLVDFFDINGIEIFLDRDFRGSWVFNIDGEECGNFPTRPKTREESIKAANQIYNENKY